jgi:hypothetical protein
MSTFDSTQIFIPANTLSGNYADSAALCTVGSAGSFRLTALNVNGTTVTTSPKNVTINGRVYTIIGFNGCNNKI